MLILAAEIQALRIQCRDYTKHNTETNTMAVTGVRLVTTNT